MGWGGVLFLPSIKLWALALDHSARTKRFTDELTLFTHSGTLRALKVRQEHPPTVIPQLDADIKSNYHHRNPKVTVAFGGEGDFETHFICKSLSSLRSLIDGAGDSEGTCN